MIPPILPLLSSTPTTIPFLLPPDACLNYLHCPHSLTAFPSLSDLRSPFHSCSSRLTRASNEELEYRLAVLFQAFTLPFFFL